jgi:hypothetical protein
LLTRYTACMPVPLEDAARVGCWQETGRNPLQGAAAAGRRRSRVHSRIGFFGVMEVGEVTEIVVVAAVPAMFGLTLGRGRLAPVGRGRLSAPTGLGQLDRRWLRGRRVSG